MEGRVFEIFLNKIKKSQNSKNAQSRSKGF